MTRWSPGDTWATAPSSFRSNTRVELEHRRLERYYTRRDEMRGIFDSEGGWRRLLEIFARAAAAAIDFYTRLLGATERMRRRMAEAMRGQRRMRSERESDQRARLTRCQRR